MASLLYKKKKSFQIIKKKKRKKEEDWVINIYFFDKPNLIFNQTNLNLTLHNQLNQKVFSVNDNKKTKTKKRYNSDNLTFFQGLKLTQVNIFHCSYVDIDWL